MSKIDFGRSTQSADETVISVRELLAPTNPVPATAFADAADDDQGRAAFHRIVTSGGGLRRAPRRRRWLVVTGTVLVVAGAGAVAGATGNIPHEVARQFEWLNNNGIDGPEGVDQGEGAIPERAQLRGQVRTPAGHLVELWTAPTESGGECTYLRETNLPDGENAFLSCGKTRFSRDEPLDTTGDQVTGGYWVEYGRVDPRLTRATAVRTYSLDGRRHYTLPVRNGYFIGMMPPYAINWDGGRTEVLDSDDRVLATFPG